MQVVPPFARTKPLVARSLTALCRLRSGTGGFLALGRISSGWLFRTGVGLARLQRSGFVFWRRQFDFFAHYSAGRWVHVVDLVACRTGHRLIDVVVLRNIFGRKALNAVSGFWAAVDEERHNLYLA